LNGWYSGLRAYAETQLIITESKGKIGHPYLQFIAGHKGDIEARYSTNKGMLPPDMMEDMREQYKGCEPFLSTTTELQQSAVLKEAQIEAQEHSEEPAGNRPFGREGRQGEETRKGAPTAMTAKLKPIPEVWTSSPPLEMLFVASRETQSASVSLPFGNRCQDLTIVITGSISLLGRDGRAK
jgi:hypothetical protein